MDQPLFDSFEKSAKSAKLADVHHQGLPEIGGADKGRMEPGQVSKNSEKPIYKSEDSTEKRRKRRYWLPFGLCAFNHHRPIGYTVHWDGEDHVGHCGKCTMPIRRIKRDGGRSKWVQKTAHDKE